MAATTITAKELTKMVCEDHEWINGNGKPGAKADLAVIKDRLDLIWKLMIGLLLAVGGTFIAAVIK